MVFLIPGWCWWCYFFDQIKFGFSLLLFIHFVTQKFWHCLSKCQAVLTCSAIASRTEKSMQLPVSRDIRKRSGRGLCQTIYRKCVQFHCKTLQFIVLKHESTWFFNVFFFPTALFTVNSWVKIEAIIWILRKFLI